MISFVALNSTQIPEIIKLMQQFYTSENYPFDIEIATTLIHQFIKNENLGKAYLIFNNDEIVGYVILTFVFSFEYKGKIAFVDELFIKPNFQGQDIGKKTMAFLKTESIKLSLKLLYLEVENNNIIAQKLYLSQDFTFHDRKIMKYYQKIDCHDF